MVTDKAKWSRDSDGTWISFRVPSITDAEDACKLLDDGKTYDITIKRHSAKRSIEANAYCWVLCGKLAEKLHITREEVYRQHIKEIGNNFEIVCVQEKAAESLVEKWSYNGLGWLADILPSKIDGCVNAVLYYGSSTYSTSQMAVLIDNLVHDCKLQGIETMTPDEIGRMVALWR